MPVTLPITIPALTGRKGKPHAAVEFLSNLASISLGKTPERRSADGSVLIPSNEVTVGDVLSSPWGLRDAAIGSPEAGAKLITGGEVDRPDRSKQLMSSLVPGWGAIPQSRGELAEFAIDNLTDPLNAVGAGVGVKAMKLPAKGMKRLPKNPRRGAVILSGPQAVDPTGVEPRPFYYSRLRDAAAALPGEKFKAQSIPNLLKKHAPEGFAQEEYDWVRVPEFLKGKQEVTKVDLLKHLDDNAIRIDARKMAGAPVEPTYYEPREGVTPREFLQRYHDRLSVDDLPPYDTPLALGADKMQVARALQSGDEGTISDFYHILTGRLQRNMQHNRELEALGDYAIRKKHAKGSSVEDADGPATHQQYRIPGPNTDYQEHLLGLAPPMKVAKSEAAYDAADAAYVDAWPPAADVRRTTTGPEADARRSLPEFQSLMEAREAHEANVKELPDYQSPHWYAQGTPDNPLLHIRTTERNTPHGKTLFADEIQSDWHQAGKQRGYEGDPIPALEFKPGRTLRSHEGKEMKSWLAEINAPDAEPGTSYYIEHSPDEDGQYWAYTPGNDPIGKFDSLEEAQSVISSRYQSKYAQDRPPQGPLKEAWPDLALKQLLRQAAEKGYDRAGWSMGEDIQKVVGGGIEGQKQFYNEELVNRAKKLFKKRGWEVPVETAPLEPMKAGELPGYQHLVSSGVADKLAAAVSNGDMTANIAASKGLPHSIGRLIESRVIKADEGVKMLKAGQLPGLYSHSFQITPQMRKDILEKGFPLMALMPFLMGFGSGEGND